MSDSDEDYDEIDLYFNGEKKQSVECSDEIFEDNKIKKSDIDKEEIIVGIDLGTTNSCVAVWRNKNLEIIPDMYGNRTIPSMIAFSKKSRYPGKEAKKQIELNPENTFYEVKRLIGRKYNDEIVVKDLDFVTYGIDHDEKDNILLKTSFDDKRYSPEEISSMILIELKNMAQDYLKRPVTKAVITVPAYFNDAQRQATKDAATIAGLECVRIINEPTAAALAYGLEKASIHKDKEITVVVYDLGGGTLDVSLLTISNGVFQVLGSAGNTHLGGVDFDNRLIGYCINEFKKKNGYQNLDDISSISMQKLKQSCEEAKKRLSETSKTTIIVKDFFDNKNLMITLTREMFEKMCMDLFIMCLKSVDDVLKSCEMEKEMIDEIILVGGCTRIPLIVKNLETYFGKKPNSSINPDEVVAAGAAIQGYILSHENDPFSENVVLLDIIPLSLGVETIGGVMNVLIPRNSVIPIKRKKKYTTDTDYETSVTVKVYEGERKMTKDNFMVGEFELTGIDSAPRGVPQIEITFAVDVNGIITVTALDLNNNDNKKIININSNKGRLSDEKIKELVDEAKKLEHKDKIEREKKQLYYEIEDLCSNIKMNVDNGDFKLKDNDKDIIKEDMKNIISWLSELPYNERNKKEYLKVIDRIKKKYGTLMLKVSNETDTVQAASSQTDATTVDNNEDDDNDIFEAIENEELGINNTDQETKNEIKRLRDVLIALCYSVFEIISSETNNMDKDHIIELKDYIDDIMLWIHVKEKIKISEYKQKIDEVNKICNDFVEKYNNTEIFTNVYTKKDELEQLCYTLMSSIMCNVLAAHEDDIQNLKKNIENTFEWLIEIELQIKKAELTSETFIIKEEEFQNKINMLNELCNKIYNSMVNINIMDSEKIIS